MAEPRTKTQAELWRDAFDRFGETAEEAVVSLGEWFVQSYLSLPEGIGRDLATIAEASPETAAGGAPVASGSFAVGQKIAEWLGREIPVDEEGRPLAEAADTFSPEASGRPVQPRVLSAEQRAAEEDPLAAIIAADQDPAQLFAGWAPERVAELQSALTSAALLPPDAPILTGYSADPMTREAFNQLAMEAQQQELTWGEALTRRIKFAATPEGRESLRQRALGEVQAGLPQRRLPAPEVIADELKELWETRLGRELSPKEIARFSDRLTFHYQQAFAQERADELAMGEAEVDAQLDALMPEQEGEVEVAGGVFLAPDGGTRITRGPAADPQAQGAPPAAEDLPRDPGDPHEAARRSFLEEFEREMAGPLAEREITLNYLDARNDLMRNVELGRAVMSQ